MRYCAICKSKGKGVSLHKYPKDENILVKWLDLMEPGFILKQNSRICSKHFQPQDFNKNRGANYLKDNIVPSLFLPPVNIYQENIKSSQKSAFTSSSSHQDISNTCEPSIDLPSISLPSNKIKLDPCKPLEEADLSTTSLPIHQIKLEPCEPSTDLPNTSLPSNQSTNVPPKSTSYTFLYSAESDHTYSVRSMALEEQIKKDKLLKHFRKVVKNLRNKVFVQSNKIKKLQNRILELENQSSLSAENVDNITDSFGDTPINSIVKTLINFGGKNNPLNNGYSIGMKKFAITLYFYSPQAYEYLRTVICLPSESTVKNWCLDKKLKPGFLKEAFDILEQMEMCQKQSVDE